MRLKSVRTLGLALALAGALISTTSLSAFVPEFFDGGGYGPSPAVAVQAAIWDAEGTASGYGLYKCTLAEEPAVFAQPRNARRPFNAQVKLRCTP